jgi:hypothetical protein
LRRPTFLPAEITGIAPDAAVGEAANTGAASRTAMIAACGRGLHLLMYGSRAVLKARRAVGGGSRGPRAASSLKRRNGGWSLWPAANRELSCQLMAAMILWP